jgi:hypothetical protein
MQALRHLRNSVTLVALTAASLAALPRLELVDSVFDIGVVNEGEREFIRHSFGLRNVGDAPLRILEVRPSCSCTGFDYDTVVPPGGSGSFRPVVDVRDKRSGPFEVEIRVATNAPNRSLQLFKVKGVLRGYMEVETPLVRLAPDADSSTEVVLRTRRANLQVQTVTFQPVNPEDASPILGCPPLFVDCALRRADSADADGYYRYALRLTPDERPPAAMPGMLCIVTNHPYRSELYIRGVAQ